MHARCVERQAQAVQAPKARGLQHRQEIGPVQHGLRAQAWLRDAASMSQTSCQSEAALHAYAHFASTRRGRWPDGAYDAETESAQGSRLA